MRRTSERPGAAREGAEVIALRALTWIAGDDDLMVGFVSVTGADLSEIRARATEPAFLAGVMDYVMADEELLLAFARVNDLQPEQVTKAARALGGGAAWEG